LSSARSRWLFSRSRRGFVIDLVTRQPPHPQKVESWTPLPSGETFNPRTDGYYSTTEYGYIDGKRSSSPETVGFLRFYPDGTFCKQHANIGNHPSDDDVMASLTPSGTDAVGFQAQCGTWDSRSYEYTAPAGLAHNEVVSVADSGFTAIAPVLMEDIKIRQEFLFQAVG
jgi:hypothetical protein